MTVRFIRSVGLVLIALGSVGTLWAGDLVSSMAREVKRRQCWPEPFNGPDRADARMPFALMVNNGWRRQNMLGDAYFNADTGKLSEAGLLKVRWIVTECPQQHRIVYVHTANTEEETIARIGAIQSEIARIAPQATQMIPVLPTSISDTGWPGEEVQMRMRDYLKNLPPPKLMAPTSSSSGGSGSM